ncbi:MAG: Chemotaxis response regulator protein-glutamate methylesterase [Bacteroidota bacterium]
MENDTKIKLFLVDDDAVFLKSLEIQFQEAQQFEVVTFATGELCVQNLSKAPEVIILDFHLDGIDKDAMNGLKTLDAIKNYNSEIPVIMLSSQDKIEVAVKCIQHDAFDYVVKSETAFLRLKKIITIIFLQKKMKQELNWYMDRM